MTRALQDLLESDGIRVLPLSCDDYYWHEWTPDAVYGYDTPAGIDAEALLADLEQLCRGDATSLRRYDMVSHQARHEPLIQAYDLIVLEGAFGPQRWVTITRCPQTPRLWKLWRFNFLSDSAFQIPMS